MIEDTYPKETTDIQIVRPASSANGRSQTSKISSILAGDDQGCDTVKNRKEYLNFQNDKMGVINALDTKTNILSNSIFVFMTLLSLAILFTEGMICISK